MRGRFVGTGLVLMTLVCGCGSSDTAEVSIVSAQDGSDLDSSFRDVPASQVSNSFGSEFFDAEIQASDDTNRLTYLTPSGECGSLKITVSETSTQVLIDEEVTGAEGAVCNASGGVERVMVGLADPVADRAIVIK